MKQFRRIWMGEFISSVGSGMTAFAVAIYVYHLTKSATMVSLVALLAFLPTVLLSPVGGILADRYDRRWMMILGDSLSVIGLLIVFIAVKLSVHSVIPIFLGITLSSIFGSLLEPAYRATVTDLLNEEEYAKASGLVQIATNSKYLISPFLAGMILSRFNIEMILLIDIGTFFVTVLTLYSVKKGIPTVKRERTSLNMRAELAEGMRVLTSNSSVKELIWLMTSICFFMAFIQTLMAPMVLAFSDAKNLGIMESLSAIGMVVGSIVIGMIQLKSGFYKVLSIALMSTGLFMALTGTTTHIWLIIVFCFLFFTSLPFVNTCADVLIRTKIPNEVQGRVWGLISLLTQSGFILAYACCGLLADYVFNPMLIKGGILADNVGKFIGTGEGRGVGLMLIIAGLMIVLMGIRFLIKSNNESQGENTHELVSV